MTNNNLNNLIKSMLKENTGINMLDSGMGNGRHWQKNKDIDFDKQPSVYIDAWDLEHLDDNSDSSDLNYLVSTYHYLTSGVLELDDLCNEFNEKFKTMDDWDAEDDKLGTIYGTSKEAQEFLTSHGFVFTNSWNTYNGDSNLSQVLQGTDVNSQEHSSNFEYPDYVLLQIHNGADVRGGYTDAKLFKLSDNSDGYINPSPTVYGDIDGIKVSTMYDGNTLKKDEDILDDENVPVNRQSKINLYLMDE